MGETLNERIENLRKRSRQLLAQADENSKKVKNEIKKLYSRNSILRQHYKNYVGKTGAYCDAHITSWNMRNDSSGVGAALHSDYFLTNSNQTLASMPHTTAVKKMVISSKKQDHQHSLDTTHRKPVKGCYCNPENRKIHLRSTRTQHKQHATCKRCKSHPTVAATPVEYNFHQGPMNSPISCETLRRVQKIDYAPRSQFLRNVRSKVTLLGATGKGDCPETCSRSHCYHQLLARDSLKNAGFTGQLETDDKTTQTNNDLGTKDTKASVGSNAEAIDRSNKGVSLKRQSDSKVEAKDAAGSKISALDVRRNKSKAASKAKRNVTSTESLHGYRNRPERSRTGLTRDNYVDSEGYANSVHVNNAAEDSGERGREYLSENEMRELRKFREQNYFDTHGSRHTLSSSKSSGSLEQYILNDRLFPEPLKRIHKRDLVVSMPPCATMQRKRIHYFPRYIVRQEKNSYNATGKKKRCQTCPLTGHAIDLGITKIKPPMNSLALKYQKLLP